MDFVEEGANIYKLIGPCLVKQTVGDAKTNINKRLEFVTSELYFLFL